VEMEYLKEKEQTTLLRNKNNNSSVSKMKLEKQNKQFN
jgi:hypothetical protein